MSEPKVKLFSSGPFPLLVSCVGLEGGDEVRGNVGLLIGAVAVVIAELGEETDQDAWLNFLAAYQKDSDVLLQVWGEVETEENNITGETEEQVVVYWAVKFSSNDCPFVLGFIKAPDEDVLPAPNDYAREVLSRVIQGESPYDLGERVDGD